VPRLGQSLPLADGIFALWTNGGRAQLSMKNAVVDQENEELRGQILALEVQANGSPFLPCASYVMVFDTSFIYSLLYSHVHDTCALYKAMCVIRVLYV
jgi:hypothetical protein